MKKNFCFKIFVTIIYCFATIVAYGQESFDFEILFSGSNFDHKNLNIQFYQGYQTLSISKNTKNKIAENSNSFLRNPILEIVYFSSKHKPTFYRFFLKKQISTIEIYYDSLTDDIRVKKKSAVLSFEEAGQNKFEAYAKNELLKIDEYNKKYNFDFTEVDSTVLSQFNIYSKAVKDKSLEFAKNNPTLLYSLWLFMYEIIGDPRYSKKELNYIYNNYFKPKYKNTFEEKYILNKLNENRLGINTNAPFQKLTFKDLLGDAHTIYSFKDKPLVITIWATWCVPCVAEIPKLKELYSKYNKDLEILSFSTDADETKLRNFVSAKNLDWPNVYNRLDFCHIYGSDLGIPQVYLIDKNGIIIYSRSKMADYDLNILEKMIEEISNNR